VAAVPVSYRKEEVIEEEGDLWVSRFFLSLRERNGLRTPSASYMNCGFPIAIVGSNLPTDAVLTFSHVENGMIANFGT
jgi:hypothetical protein